MLNAIGNEVRARILRILHTEGPLSFTEIMARLRMDPKRDAGKFGYHLKLLVNAQLVGIDPSTEKYSLTDLGRAASDLLLSLEELSRKKTGEMLVRTSKLAIEPFDKRRIAEALMREANVPKRLAESIAREAEERLSSLQVKYLTAALIREFVNMILIEKGLEEYRHVLTRLGLPVFDVSQLIKSISRRQPATASSVFTSAGKHVLAEYALLKALPRPLADAHLSGACHICNLSSWALRPANVFHDLRAVLQYGLPGAQFLAPARSLKDALLLAKRLLMRGLHETSVSQTLSMFNIFLAPLASQRTQDPDLLLDSFLDDICHLNGLADFPSLIGIELSLEVPSYLAHLEASIPSKGGNYLNYQDEALKLADMVLSLLLKKTKQQGPLVLPQLVLRLPSSPIQEKALGLVAKAVELSLEGQQVLFTFDAHACFSPDFSFLAMERPEAWELYCLRTGVLENVLVNLPRIALKSKGDDSLFMEGVNEVLTLVIDAFQVKRSLIEDRLKSDMLLPLLGDEYGGESYFRLDYSVTMVSLLGLAEAAFFHTGEHTADSSSSLNFALKVVKAIRSFLDEFSLDMRVTVSEISLEQAAPRLARLDSGMGLLPSRLSNYGKDFFYTELQSTPYYKLAPLKRRIEVESAVHNLVQSGAALIVKLPEPPPSINELTSFVNGLRGSGVKSLILLRDLTFCEICRWRSGGLSSKCRSCGHSGSKLIGWSLIHNRFKPSIFWTKDDKLLLLHEAKPSPQEFREVAGSLL